MPPPHPSGKFSELYRKPAGLKIKSTLCVPAGWLGCSAVVATLRCATAMRIWHGRGRIYDRTHNTQNGDFWLSSLALFQEFSARPAMFDSNAC